MTTESHEGRVEVIPAGYIADFISRLPVRATAEEVDAVQVFSRRLVEDLGYSREQVQTRPQHRLRIRPSDSPGSYPVDIAVFAGESRNEEDLVLVVECKKKTRRSGRRQLEIYLTMNMAPIGAWFNGEEHLYPRKHYLPDGEIVFEEIPALPRAGQRVEDIGKYRREDLVPTHALRPIFRDVRNHLAGNLTGITRDETLAQQIINVLFCKIYDEMDKGPSEYPLPNPMSTDGGAWCAQLSLQFWPRSGTRCSVTSPFLASWHWSQPRSSSSAAARQAVTTCCREQTSILRWTILSSYPGEGHRTIRVQPGKRHRNHLARTSGPPSRQPRVRRVAAWRHTCSGSGSNRLAERGRGEPDRQRRSWGAPVRVAV